MISIHRTLEVVGIGQCSRIGGDQSAVGFSGKSTASSRVGNSCGGKMIFLFLQQPCGRAKKKIFQQITHLLGAW